MNIFNGMRKIGGQKSSTTKGKDIFEDEEELNFDQELLEEEDSNPNTIPVEVNTLTKHIGKLDDDVLNIVEEADVGNKLNNIQELPKLTMKSDNMPKDINQLPLIKIENDIEFQHGNLEDIEMPSDNNSKNSVDGDILESGEKFSVYVKNVDYDACPGDLEEHFKNCGLINRITILIDKYTGLPKGYAFIEFDTYEAKEKAKILNDSLFKGRQIKVDDKRKNLPEYFGKKTKSFNKQPVYFHNQNNMRGQSHSFFGPIKGRYMPSRNFKPY